MSTMLFTRGLRVPARGRPEMMSTRFSKLARTDRAEGAVCWYVIVSLEGESTHAENVLFHVSLTYGSPVTQVLCYNVTFEPPVVVLYFQSCGKSCLTSGNPFAASAIPV